MKTQWLPSYCAPCASAPLQQSVLYGAALRLMGRDVALWGCQLGGDQIATAQVIQRKPRFGPRVSLLARGPVWRAGVSDADKLSALRQLSHKMGALWVTNAQDPDDATCLARAHHLPLLTPQTMAELDLRGSESGRRARQHGKWRNRLAHAEAAGLKTTHQQFDPNRDGWLLRAEAAQRQARGYHTLPEGFVRAAAASSPKSLRLFVAVRAAEPVAAMLVLRHGRVATYHIGWSGPQGRATSAHNLLLWQASQWAAAEGLERFDLGTIETKTAAGLARFKLGSGARARTLGPTMLHSPLTAPLARLCGPTVA